MDDDKLLSVGDLARAAGLSSKALRHYDRIGLFRPTFVDDAGYRWYSVDQVETAQLIATLRSVDVPLDDVRRALTSSGPVGDVLLAQRRRLESRLTRVRGDLHRISHLLDDGMDSPMAHEAASPISPDDQRELAKYLFNRVWSFMEREDRTPEDDDTMLNAAHSSRYHWSQVGTPRNIARGDWQVSRVYALLRRAEPCLYHAQHVLDICRSNGFGDFDLAFAYEALARGQAVAGDAAAARAYTEQALAVAEDIAEDDDRELLLSDLETIPGQPRFW
jgi:DNA-binding transcriptional MerR regulator